MEYMVIVNGKEFEAVVEEIFPILPSSQIVQTSHQSQNLSSSIMIPEEPPVVNIEVTSKVEGSVHGILVSIGQNIKEGDTVAVLKFMKMDMEVKAPAGGLIKQILVNTGTLIHENDVLFVISQ
ncbi:biotin/lipoyl-containing protein [uncultured Ilyobacter sp.]|jgi:pyruvate carboxylase subunit B|uniref:biotin/lipoyl-containing protein n=1 Tax=uncultured Ilyobacter sp. TaxID=544433 RepID=UPI002AA781EC|nr:biotin/lipoyl-containing protein [uncultured Ilyobacter sp.]